MQVKYSFLYVFPTKYIQFTQFSLNACKLSLFLDRHKIISLCNRQEFNISSFEVALEPPVVLGFESFLVFCIKLLCMLQCKVISQPLTCKYSLFLPFLYTQQRAVLVVNKRNVTRKFKTRTQLWQILIKAKIWPIREKENRQLLLQWPNLILYSRLQKCFVTVLLLTSTALIRSSSFGLSY